METASGSRGDIPAGPAMEPRPWLLLENNLTYARRWDRDTTPEFAAFRKWTARYRSETTDAGRRALEAEGVSLAQARRTVLRELIETDPRRALAVTIPAAMRQDLPETVLAELEVRVAGRGDFRLACALPRPGAREAGQSWRTARVDGVTYQAFSYGRRDGQLSRIGTSLHGIALDGSMAVHDHPVRFFEAGETSALPAPAFCVVTGGAISETSTRVEMFGVVHAVADPALLETLVGRVLEAEDSPDPRVEPVLRGDGLLASAAEPLPPTAWTTGVKQVLVIRVDFPDFTGEPITTASGSTLIDTSVSSYFSDASYGATSMVATVSASVYRMPQNGATYATSDDYEQLLEDARSLAAANYTLANFDRIIVAFRSLGTSAVPGSQFTWAGLADVGGPNVWVNGSWNFRVVAHEMGHNYGLRHANLWQASGNNPVSSSGSSTEYGDPFDVMGGGSTDSRHHFNPWFKNRLGWISDASVEQVTASGTYRVARFDHAATNADLPRALNIFRDGVRSYWVGYRKNFPTAPSLNNGAYALWGYYSNRPANLLDMTTPGISASDAGLSVGSSFVDSTYGVTIQPTSTGGTAPNEYIDVSVTFNRPAVSHPVMWGQQRGADGPFGLFGVQAVAGGMGHSLALRTDGTVVAWGRDTNGESSVPGGLSGVIAIAAGDDTSGAVKSNGAIVLWGDASDGQTTPPDGLSGVVKLALGSEHALALKSDGTVVAWGGTNVYGERTVPGGLANVIDIAAGNGVSLALRSDGTVTRWGANYGAPPGGLTDVTKIASGAAHHLALKSDGTIVVWGNNTYQQGDVPGGLTEVGDIAAGGFHSVVARSDGSVVSWGYNVSGQTFVPPGMPSVARVGAGDNHSLAIVGDLVVPPDIVTHPAAQAVAAGQGIALSVGATGTGTLTYQWQLNGVDIAGATGSTYTIRRGQAFHAGTYRVVVSIDSVSTTSNGALVTVNPAVASDARLMNISTRGLSLIDSEALIPGFVIQGAGSKRLLIRAVGPTLGGFGVPDTLVDPTLVLKKWNPAVLPNGAYEDVTSNDNWGANPNAAEIATAAGVVGAFPLANGSADAALLLDLGTGQYSVVAGGVGNSTGVAIVEVYDVDSGSPSTRLVNISNRGFVGIGANIMIPGFVVSNEGPRTFLVRAVGPTLGAFGVSGTLADPVLDVFESVPGSPATDVLILSNDDWDGIPGSATTASVAASVGAFALNAGTADAAFVVTLPPGIYTVNARGKNEGTGIALVEVYLVP